MYNSCAKKNTSAAMCIKIDNPPIPSASIKFKLASLLRLAGDLIMLLGSGEALRAEN